MKNVNQRLAGLCLVFLLIFAAGCGGSVKPDDLAAMQAKSKSLTQYSFDYVRQIDNQQTKGKFYYKDGNIRFEVTGATPEDTTVTIVNKSQGHSYIYNTKIKKGENASDTNFFQDVPLPQEIMSVLTPDNTKFLNQENVQGQNCSLFTVNQIQLPGSTFIGKVWIFAEQGVPTVLDGFRTGNTKHFRYEYQNFKTGDISDSLFQAPGDIEFSQR